MQSKTLVLNFDAIIGEKEYIICEGGPGWGGVGYTGYQKAYQQSMEERIIETMLRWYKTIHLITPNPSVRELLLKQMFPESRTSPFSFTPLEKMILPSDLLKKHPEIKMQPLSGLLAESKSLSPGLVVIDSSALNRETNPHHVAGLAKMRAANLAVLNGFSDTARLPLTKGFLYDLFGRLAPRLVKNSTVVHLEHLEASDEALEKIKGQWVILKPTDGVRAIGVVVLPKKHLKETLVYLASAGDETLLPKYFSKRPKDLGKLHELRDEISKTDIPCCVVQKFVVGAPVKVKGEEFCSAVRFVVAANFDASTGSVDVQFVGGYNKLAMRPMTSKSFDWDERITSSHTNQYINSIPGGARGGHIIPQDKKQTKKYPQATRLSARQEAAIRSQFLPELGQVFFYLFTHTMLDYYKEQLAKEGSAMRYLCQSTAHFLPFQSLKERDCEMFFKQGVNVPRLLLHTAKRQLTHVKKFVDKGLMPESTLKLLTQYTYRQYGSFTQESKAELTSSAGMLCDELSSRVNQKERPDLFEGLTFLKNPTSFSAQVNMAKAAYESGEYKQAYAAYRVVLPQCESGKEKATCVYNMGSCQLKLRNFPLAKKHYETALSMQTVAPKIQKIKLKLAQLHSISDAAKQAKAGLTMFKEERFVRAKTLFSNAVSLANESKLCPDLLGTYYYNLGSCHARLGEHVEAIEACKASVEIRSAYFGENHPGTLSSKQKVAVLQESVGLEKGVKHS